LIKPRIIFMPGMKPKPPVGPHRHALLRALVSGLSWVRPDAARALAAHEEWFTLVEWTHRFYGRYRDIGLDVRGIDHILQNPEPSEEDVHDIQSMARRVRRLGHVVGDALPFLGRFIAQPELRVTMSEVRRYFGDEHGIATEIRGLLASALEDAFRADEAVLLIGHSLGSVIAYDTLWELTHERAEHRRIDLFLTIGSPLATRFIRKGLRGANLTGAARYPGNLRRWINFAAIGEMTALRPMRPHFGAMIDLGLIESIEDHMDLYNHFRGDIGLNVHKSYGYLAHRQVADCIGEWLEGCIGLHGQKAASESDDR
jgi:pimeloyl-ACP methyl ester carboxylesterase